MSITAIPSAFPAEGVFQSSVVHVDLSCVSEHACIHYTLDGSEPTKDSPLYHREEGLIPLRTEPGTDCRHVIRAFAEAPGQDPSPLVTFTYHLFAGKKGHYTHQMMQEPREDQAGIIRIEDFDRDKMYLIIGSQRAVLVDAGWDFTGDLPSLCRALTGGDLPIDLVVGHGHPDHIAQLPDFVRAGCRVYLPHADRDCVKSFYPDMDTSAALDIREGDLLDLGNMKLRVFTVSGHTPGSIVLMDESSGDLFSSDTLGSNRSHIGDSAWLQLSEYSIEEICENLKKFIDKIGDRANRIFGGHNEQVLEARPYLASLLQAMEEGLEKGQEGLYPSLRSGAECMGSGTVVSHGNWRADPNWAAANLRYLYKEDRLANPPRYARGFTPLPFP